MEKRTTNMNYSYLNSVFTPFSKKEPVKRKVIHMSHKVVTRHQPL